MDIVRAARSVCEPILLFRSDAVASAPDLLRLARSFTTCAVVDSTTDLEPLGLSGLTTFHDDDIDFVEMTLRDLRLPTALHQERPWDKVTQRETLWRSGLGQVRAIGVDHAEDLRTPRIGPPGVLKPRRGVSGRGVTIVPDAAVLSEVARTAALDGYLFEQLIPAAPHPSGVPYLGEFVSVEVASDDRDHHVLAVFDKIPPTHTVDSSRAGRTGRILMAGDVYPTRLPSSALEEVVVLVSAALEALGVRWRLTHTEVMCTPYGFEIIEVNGRVGGDLDRLLALGGGPSLPRTALQLAIGRRPDPRLAVEPPSCVLGFYPAFPDRSGPVRSDVAAEEVRRHQGLVGLYRLATHGAAREETAWRAVDVTLRAGDWTELDRRYLRLGQDLIALFAPDELATGEWARWMM